MKNKVLKSLLGLMILFGVMTPLSSVFAYSGGLLEGKTLVDGAAIGTKSASSLNYTKLTDGNEATEDTINWYASSHHIVFYTFASPVDIQAYQLKGRGSLSITWKKADGTSGTFGTTVITGLKTNITPLTNVSSIGVSNTSGNYSYVNEFDVFAVPDTTPPGNVTGLNETHNHNSATLSWTNPADADFNGVKIFNGDTLLATLPKGTTSYKVTGLTPSSPYTFKVTSTDGTGNLATGITISLTTLAPPPIPSAPTGLTATAGNSSVTLNWSEVDIATEYKIYQDGKFIASTSTKTFVVNDLTNGTSYSFQVSAANGNGEGGKSNSVSATPTLQPPSGLAAIAGNTNVSLDWNDVGGATSYKIYQDGSLLTTTTTKPYLIKGLTNGTVYSYQVSAVNGSIESAKTAVVTAKPDNPAVPSGFTATPGNKEISLDWNIVPNATSYKIYKDGSFLTTVTTKPFLITSLTNGTVYSFEITAVNAIGESEKSAPVTASPIDFLAPTGLASNVSDSRVVLSWNPSPLATKYRLYRDGVLLSEIEGSSYSDSSVTNGTNYKYEVSAVNSSNESPKSAAIFAKPSKYISNISTTTLPFTVVDMAKTALNYLKLFPSWILLVLAVIFVPALIFIVIWLVNRNKKEKIEKQAAGGSKQRKRRSVNGEPRSGGLQTWQGKDGVNYIGASERWIEEQAKAQRDHRERTTREIMGKAYVRPTDRELKRIEDRSQKFIGRRTKRERGR
jgi:hypothetical protein